MANTGAQCTSFGIHICHPTRHQKDTSTHRASATQIPLVSRTPTSKSVARNTILIHWWPVYVVHLQVSLRHGVRHGQKSGRANTEYIVYKNYNSL